VPFRSRNPSPGRIHRKVLARSAPCRWRPRSAPAPCPGLKKRRPRDLAVPGPNLGVGVRHALFPVAHLGRSRFRGRCASRRHSVRQRTAVGLMAGPSRPLRGGILSEASAPRSYVPCRERLAGRGADTPATWLFRVGTVLAGTAPAFGRALAPCYGSSLLTLRLLSDLQLGDAGWRRRPKRRRFRGLCRARSLPASTSSLRASLCEEEAFWRGDPAGQRTCVLVCAVAAVTLWVTASAHGSKRSVNLTRRGGGFCFAPGRTAPDSWQLARSRHRPEELVICACGGACAPPRGRRHQLPPSVPRSPGIIPVALRRVFHAAVVSTVLSRNKAIHVRTPKNGKKKMT